MDCSVSSVVVALWLSGPGARGILLWEGTRIKPVYSSLAGGFLTTGPPKSRKAFFKVCTVIHVVVYILNPNYDFCGVVLFPEVTAAAAKLLQSCPTRCDPIDCSPPGSPSPWDSPGKNTGVGCHFLLQCMKVRSESEVAQSCLTLSDPMDCSPPGSSVHGIFQARVLEWGAIAFSSLRSLGG